VSFDSQAKRNEVHANEKCQCTDKKYLGKHNGSRKKINTEEKECKTNRRQRRNINVT
jgi:hypothetical protein